MGEIRGEEEGERDCDEAAHLATRKAPHAITNLYRPVPLRMRARAERFGLGI